jgi:hypothetical protein
MGEILEWVQFGVDTLFRTVGFALAGLQLVFFYKVFRWWAYERPAISRHGTASPSVLARRLFCGHRHIYRSRDQWGKHSTFCLRCNVDVNAGKPQEEWR